MGVNYCDLVSALVAVTGTGLIVTAGSPRDGQSEEGGTVAPLLRHWDGFWLVLFNLKCGSKVSLPVSSHLAKLTSDDDEGEGLEAIVVRSSAILFFH